jgi:Collagen triple helix repeat (20 copies)
MKKVSNLLVAAVAVMLFASSCGKDGAVGPKGTQGVQGAVGSVGPVGPAGPAGTNGQNGSVIYSGSGTTAITTIGAIGDFYLDLSTGMLYGPKTATGWGTGFSLIGPTGANGATGATGAIGAIGATGAKGATGATGATGAAGAPGSKILSGTGAPAASLGSLGDYYLDKASFMLYGPKIAAGWGPAVSLQGPPGTANVEYSGWNFTSNFRDTTADGSSLNVGDLLAPALTQSLLDNGAFQVYFTFGAGVYTLPYTSFAGGAANTMSYWPRLGHFIVTRFTADNSNTIKLSAFIQYRYIMIPGGVKVGVNHHPDLNNYEAVRKFYRIPD